MHAPRKLLLFIATSLDGYIAGPDGEIDWLFSDQDYGFKDFYSRLGAVAKSNFVGLRYRFLRLH